MVREMLPDTTFLFSALSCAVWTWQVCLIVPPPPLLVQGRAVVKIRLSKELYWPLTATLDTKKGKIETKAPCLQAERARWWGVKDSSSHCLSNLLPSIVSPKDRCNFLCVCTFGAANTFSEPALLLLARGVCQALLGAPVWWRTQWLKESWKMNGQSKNTALWADFCVVLLDLELSWWHSSSSSAVLFLAIESAAGDVTRKTSIKHH